MGKPQVGLGDRTHRRLGGRRELQVDAAGLGKGAGADITITAFEPSRKLAFEAVEHGKHFSHTFTFAPAGDGTTITRDIDAPLPPVISLVAKPAIRKEAAAALQMLKERLESSSA